MEPERLVGDDEDGVDGPPAEGVHESDEVAVDVALAAAVDGEGGDAISQPFHDFVVPILKAFLMVIHWRSLTLHVYLVQFIV